MKKVHWFWRLGLQQGFLFACCALWSLFAGFILDHAPGRTMSVFCLGMMFGGLLMAWRVVSVLKISECRTRDGDEDQR